MGEKPVTHDPLKQNLIKNLMPNYDDALALFHEWTKTEGLRRHAYAVESAMEYYAQKFGEDVEQWRLTGLLHDMDYEKHPTLDEHPFVGIAVLREKGYPEEIIEAMGLPLLVVAGVENVPGGSIVQVSQQEKIPLDPLEEREHGPLLIESQCLTQPGRP